MDFFKNPLLLVFVFIIVFAGGLYLIQDRILFIRQPMNAARLNFLREAYPNAEEVSITSSDGIILHGWFVKAEHGGKAPLIIYFGGNAEEVSGQIETAGEIKEWSLLLINYRGYGRSGGKPGQEELFGDAVEIYDHFSKRDDVDETQIVAMGRSLGTGVAVHLAGKRSLKGVILVAPYDSITNVAREAFSFLPVSPFLRHRFDVVSGAPGLEVPLLAITAKEDEVISEERSQKLIDSWGGPVTQQVIPGEGHNTMQEAEVFLESINAFLETL